MKVEIIENNVIVTAPGLKVGFLLSNVEGMSKTDFKESYSKKLFGYTEDVYNALPKKSTSKRRKPLKSTKKVEKPIEEEKAAE